MKMGIKNILEKYWYYITLFIVTIIALSFNGLNKDKIVYFNKAKLELKDNVYVTDNTYYISYEDLKLNFNENVFYDKISKKLILTTWDKVVKVDNVDAIKEDNKLWYDIEYLANKFNFDVVKSKNYIYILNSSYIDAKITNYRVELYDISKNEVTDIIDKSWNIKVIEDSLNEDSKWVMVVASKDENVTVGRVLKCKLEYDYEYVTKEEVKEDTKKQVIVNVQDTLSKNTDITKVTGIYQNLLRLSYENKVTKNNIYRPSGYSNDMYALFTNGYKYSNFDADILTYMLSSNENKEKIITDVIDFVNENKLNGIVLDFKNFKTSDKELLTEYIKELGANLHINNKKMYVKVNNLTSIDIKGIENFVDYIIVEAYGERTLHSKTFGAYSSVTYVDNMIDNILKLNIDSEKLILEISPNSLLFTIRAGTIIDTELYNMSAVNEYVKLNNLEINTDNTNKMHYIDFKKGITTYKMWIEDEYSIKEKINIVQNNNMAGVSINKSGDEIKSIYDIIKNTLK